MPPPPDRGLWSIWSRRRLIEGYPGNTPKKANKYRPCLQSAYMENRLPVARYSNFRISLFLNGARGGTRTRMTRVEGF